MLHPRPAARLDRSADQRLGLCRQQRLRLRLTGASPSECFPPPSLPHAAARVTVLFSQTLLVSR